MTLLIIIIAIYAIYSVSANASARKREAQRVAESNRIKREQARMKEEWKQRVAEAKIETDRMIRIEREQARQAEQLAKHEKRISDLEYRMEQAEADIEHWTQTMCDLEALLDLEQAEQIKAVKGSKTDIKCQKRIIALNNQIHSAESRIAKAKHVRTMAEQELSA